MTNKKIYIFGGAGSIGSELVRQLADKNEIIVFDIDETRMFDLVEELRLEGKNVRGFVIDVRDTSSFFGKPDIIINAAARKHVTPMEDTPMEAVSVNIRGTHNLLVFAARTGAKLINISTDKVVNADSIMGATKKVAELMVKNASQISVRFGNVLGSRGSVLPIWQKQIDEGKPLTVTDGKMTRYMMTIEEACGLIIEAAETGKPKSIYILDMGQPVNVLELAKDILKKSGKDLDIKMIGSRSGEKLTEKLMTAEELKVAVKKGKFYIINL